MLWDKIKNEVNIQGASGYATTKKMHGLIQHIIVIPKRNDIIWTLRILDSDNDVIFEKIDHKGRLDDKEGLPIGKDKQESVRLMFDEVTENLPIKVILKLREIR